jgi:hypothetical protein
MGGAMRNEERLERLEHILAKVLALLVESEVCAGPGGQEVQRDLQRLQAELSAAGHEPG